MKWFVVLPFLLSLFGCGGSASEEPEPVGRVFATLRKVDPRPLEEAATAIAFDLRGSLPEGATVLEGEVQPVELSEGSEEQLLRVKGDTPVLEFTGSFDPTLFTHVAVTFRNRGKVDFRVKLLRNDTMLVWSSMKRYDSSTEPRSVLLELPRLRSQVKSFQELQLEVGRNEGGFELAEVSLVRMPVESLAPPPGDPSHVRIGQESRPSVGLFEGVSLTDTMEVPEGAVLEFDFAQPAVLRQHREQLVLKLLLEAGDQSETFQFDAKAADKELELPWVRHSIPLAHLAGREIGLVFSIESKAARPAACLISPPSIFVTRPESAVTLVTSDTHRGDHFGLRTDGAGVKTPFLDSLASQGAYFEDCYTATTITNPSHITLMTAHHPRDTRITNNITRLAGSATTLAELFRERGYVTLGAVSAQHMTTEQSGLAQGFDRFSTPDRGGQRDSAETIEILEGWLEEYAGRPLFVWLHVFDAHAPYLPPEGYVDPYYPADRDPRSEELPELESIMRVPWNKEVRDADYIRALYKGEVTYLDGQMERILSHPRLKGQLLGLTSDHGEHLGQNGLYWTHQHIKPQVLDVPLLLSGPGVPPGTRVRKPVRQWDLGRTLLDLAGIEAPDFPGTNLLDEQAQGGPRYAIGSHGIDASVQLGKWMLVLHLSKNVSGWPKRLNPKHTYQLYDIESDPLCLLDVKDQQPEAAAKLREDLIGWLQQAGELQLQTASTGKDADALAQLAALGYATGLGDTGSSDWVDPECACEACVAAQAAR